MTTTHAEYAFQRRQGAQSIAYTHAVLDQPLKAGRLVRDRGDALCRPRRRFWGLAVGADREATCPRCITLAERYGVVLPA